MRTLLSVMMFLVFGQGARSTPTPGYPSQWWIEIPRTSAASWEILPQDAGAGEVILSKRTELALLSNFAATPFNYRGKKYASVEGFWQMMKYPDLDDPDDPRRDSKLDWPYTRAEVAQMTGFDAKRTGDQAKALTASLGIDWVSFEGKRFKYRSAEQGEHYRLILDAMGAKLAQNPRVATLLKSTGSLILRPDHKGSPEDPAEWKYFEIWMRLRNQSR